MTLSEVRAAGPALSARTIKKENTMRLRIFNLAAMILSAALVPFTLAAQQHHHYKLVDLGTFGGPGGGIVNPSSPALNNRGMLVGASDTAAPDPFAPNMCFSDCFVIRGFRWSNGRETELPALPSARNLSSIPSAINNFGVAVGQAQNGKIDSSTGFPETRAVLWPSRGIVDLGTLGGTQGIANVINDFGQVVGASLTATPDPFANSPLAACLRMSAGLGSSCGTAPFSTNSVFFPGTTQTHAFLWQGGFMHDLGTLGGPDSNAWFINDLGQVTGWSFTSFTANASTGVPTVDPFFFDPEDGKMIDMGSLGGTFGSVAWLNNKGQVAGDSNLAGDATQHPFIWSKATGMKDLGSLGGGFGHSDAINDAGEVVGQATTKAELRHAFLWRNGVMSDLGTIGTDDNSESGSINSQGQAVGASCLGGSCRGAIWAKGAPPAVDLNALTLPGTTMFISEALLINDRGEIGCLGLDPGDTEEHACVLIPCDENHKDVEGCDFSMVDASAIASEASSARATPSSVTGNTAANRTSHRLRGRLRP
jgi:probable HAF family extracellular repeat protein